MKHNHGTTIAFPVRFWASCAKLEWEIVQEAESPILKGFSFPGPMGSFGVKDSWELLREFLSLRTDQDDSILSFLKTHGEFRSPVQARLTQLRRTPADRKKVYLDIFEKQTLPAVQDYLRGMLLSGDATLTPPWKHSRLEEFRISFSKTRAGSEAQIRVNGVFPTLLATVQFKLVQGATFKTCARKDCGLPFEVTSLHKRNFCTQYCAHITSLRNRRKVQQNAKAKGR